MITRKWEKVKDNALFAIIEICTFISLLFWSGEGVLTALNILSTLPFRLVWTGRAHNVHPLVPRGKQTPALGPSYHRHICIEQKYIISVTISLSSCLNERYAIIIITHMYTCCKPCLLWFYGYNEFISCW